jgi:hypothetical protein
MVDTQQRLNRLNGTSEQAAVCSWVMLPPAPDGGVGAARWCEWDIAITFSSGVENLGGPARRVGHGRHWFAVILAGWSRAPA